MKKKVERPWEQVASNKQSAGVKMETDTKHSHTHSHNCSDHHHNHTHSPKSSKTEKKENGKIQTKYQLLYIIVDDIAILVISFVTNIDSALLNCSL